VAWLGVAPRGRVHERETDGDQSGAQRCAVWVETGAGVGRYNDGSKGGANTVQHFTVFIGFNRDAIVRGRRWELGVLDERRLAGENGASSACIGNAPSACAQRSHGVIASAPRAR
jgi:hypothetical protein